MGRPETMMLAAAEYHRKDSWPQTACSIPLTYKPNKAYRPSMPEIALPPASYGSRRSSRAPPAQNAYCSPDGARLDQDLPRTAHVIVGRSPARQVLLS